MKSFFILQCNMSSKKKVDGCKSKVLNSDARKSVITVAELKAICRHEKLKCSGTKEELCKRVITHIRNMEKGVYAPRKYFEGLSPAEKVKRLKTIKKGTKSDFRDPKAYVKFDTDYIKKDGKKVRRDTKTSSYTKSFENIFPDAKSLKQKAQKTGVPEDILKKVYNKGLAAHRTGHRPGATASQWGYARVHSFLMKGCTYYSPDHKLVEEAKQRSPKAKKWWSSRKKTCRK
jgi:hypothetical protein